MPSPAALPSDASLPLCHQTSFCRPVLCCGSQGRKASLPSGDSGVALSLTHLPSSETALSEALRPAGVSVSSAVPLGCPQDLASTHPLSNQSELNHSKQHYALSCLKLNGFPGDMVMSELRYREKNLCKRGKERKKETETDRILPSK